MSPRKHSGPNRSRGGNKRHREIAEPHNELSAREINSDNAQRREQRKRSDSASIDQQGERANVRQNTTSQGHGRPK